MKKLPFEGRTVDVETARTIDDVYIVNGELSPKAIEAMDAIMARFREEEASDTVKHEFEVIVQELLRVADRPSENFMRYVVYVLGARNFVSLIGLTEVMCNVWAAKAGHPRDAHISMKEIGMMAMKALAADLMGRGYFDMDTTIRDIMLPDEKEEVRHARQHH